MYEKLFSLAGIAILLWLLLILLPTWRGTRFLADIAIFPMYLAALYAIGIIMAIVGSGFGFVQDIGSAEGVIKLLSKPDFALLVWLHLLCFDQAIGHYVYKDNMEHQYVSIPMQSILLFLILMFGPLGLLCYLVLRQVRKRNKITL
ncbi:abscisic acid-deficient protein Aba4 family protein [Microbacteriaceae bacterium 4G12]